MIQLIFTVRALTQPGQKIKIVGSINSLGEWNTENALTLTLVKQFWEGIIAIPNPQTKLQFKLIKVKPNKQIQWETLPNNSNRKFKPKFSTQFHLEWSKPAGKVNSIQKINFKSKEHGVSAKKDKLNDLHKKKSQQFDPYTIAHYDDSGDSDEEQFLIVRRKMSDQINFDTGDLQEIYYKNSPLQIFSMLLKKLKVYVITKELQKPHSLHSFIQYELSNLPANYLPRWITEDCFDKKQFNQIYTKMKMKKTTSIFQIKTEELQLQTLYSRTSYFVLLQIDVALNLGLKLQKVPCCLFLPAEMYDKAIQQLPLLNYIDLICFDKVQTNNTFNQYLQDKQDQYCRHYNFTKLLLKEVPSLQFLIKQLQVIRQKDILIPTFETISEVDCLKNLIKPNSIAIIDASTIINQPHFISNIIKDSDQHSMQVIIGSNVLPFKIINQLKAQKNIVLIDHNFQKIILQGKQYFPLRSFRQVIEQLKLKSTIYKNHLGGQIIERQNCLIYTLPQSKSEVANKIQNQCNNIIRKFEFAKVSKKANRVKISWNLSKQVRLIRTICQIKLMKYGELGNFYLISNNLNLKDMREDIKLLIQQNPKIFVNKEATVQYYTFSQGEKHSLNIVPEAVNY